MSGSASDTPVMTDLSQVLAGHLARLRPVDEATGKAISVNQWAEALGFDRKQLGRLLVNAHEPQLNTLELLAGKLKTDPLDLITPDDASRPPGIGLEQEVRLLGELTESERAEVRGFAKRLLSERKPSGKRLQSAGGQNRQ